MAQIYWIRKPEHGDMFTQGYIGFTSRAAGTRYSEHITESRSSYKRRKDTIHKAIAKYGDSLVLEVLIECDDEYGLWLEKILRPSPKIGWNILAGGNLPPNHTGKKRTAEQNFKQSVRMRESGISPQMNAEVISKIIATKRETGTWNVVKTDTSLDTYWPNADLLYSLWNRYKDIDIRVLCRLCRVPYSSRVYDITRYFKSGFVPTKNEQWIRDFKVNDTSHLESISGNDIFILTPHYQHPKANRLWVIANEVKCFLDGNPDVTRFGANKYYNLPDKSINLLYEKIKSGWCPLNDEYYLEWLAKQKQESIQNVS